MKRILFLLCIPFFLFSMQKDESAETHQQTQNLRPTSFMNAIIRLQPCKFKLALAQALFEGQPPEESCFEQIPTELKHLISKDMQEVVWRERNFDPQVFHAIDYIIDTIDKELEKKRYARKNKLEKVIKFIELCPLVLTIAIKDAFVQKYRWKYKKSLAHNSNMVWLNKKNCSPLRCTIILDHQQIKTMQNGTITVTDLKTDQEIFRTQLRFANPLLQLRLHSNSSRLLIKDPTNWVTQLVWYLPSRFDTIINEPVFGGKRKHPFHIKNGRIEGKAKPEEEKETSQKPKKRRK